MKKAFRIIWWNQKDGKESVDMDVMVVAERIDDVISLFKKELPDYDTNGITNIEPLASKVILG